MTRNTTSILDSGDPFPQFALSLIEDRATALPAEFAGRWGVVLVYRGHW